jgi:hypothetical protein
MVELRTDGKTKPKGSTKIILMEDRKFHHNNNGGTVHIAQDQQKTTDALTAF